MEYLLVHPIRKTVHEPSCRWLAGTKTDLHSYEKRAADNLPSGARACSWCAPAILRSRRRN